MTEKDDKLNAKQRYDSKCPVLSVRITKEERDKIDDMIGRSGMNQAQFIRQALHLESEKSNKVYDRGHEDGYREAKTKYSIRIRCSVCGETMIVTKDETKKLVRLAAEMCNSYHEECIPPDVPTEDCILMGHRKEKDADKGKKLKKKPRSA